MNIVLLAHNLRASGGLAVGKGIISVLPDLAPMHNYLIFVPANSNYPHHSNKPNVSIVECPQKGLLHRLIWERRIMRRAIKDFNPDWIWCLGNIGFAHPVCRMSVLFHKPHSIYPHRHHGYSLIAGLLKRSTSLLVQRVLIRRGLQAADRVYCQTETVRKRLIMSYRLPDEKVGICPSSITLPRICHDISVPKALFEIKKNHERVLLMPGKFMAHKNFRRVFYAFRSIPDSIACVFTISSDDGKQARRLIDAIKRERLSIYCVGMIPANDMAGWYQNVDGIIFPSLMETLGLPHLEAMHWGCPVIASDLDFAHEVCGESALFVNPFSEKSIRDGILKLCKSNELCNTLRTQGRQRTLTLQIGWNNILSDILDQEGIEHR